MSNQSPLKSKPDRISSRDRLRARVAHLKSLNYPSYHDELIKLEELVAVIDEKIIHEQLAREQKEADRIDSPAYQKLLQADKDYQERLLGRTFEEAHRSIFQSTLYHFTRFREDPQWSGWSSSFKLRKDLSIWVFVQCRKHRKTALHPTYDNFLARKFRCKECRKDEHRARLLKIKKIAGCPGTLEMPPRGTNIRKGDSCSITEQELRSLFRSSKR